MTKIKLKVALVGNPNSGKSTLFNRLTGLNQKIANLPGVTVEKKTGTCAVTHNGDIHEFDIIDLPGTYSLYPKTPDEQVPFSVLCDPQNESHPDLTIIVADGTNLKRSLFLATQVMDLRKPAILVINMLDLVRKSGVTIDFEKLSAKLGIPVIPANLLEGEGIAELKGKMIEEIPAVQSDFINSASFDPELVAAIRNEVKLNSNYGAFQVANNLAGITYFRSRPERMEKLRQLIDSHGFQSGKMQAAESLKRYEAITEILKTAVLRQQEGLSSFKLFTQKLDNVLLHKFWGYVIFLVVMFAIFQSVFAWAEWPMEKVDELFTWLSATAATAMPPGILNDLVVEGILAGLGGVVIFIPQIAILFFFISLLEDSGYMARVSFMMDKLLRRFGLNGRSVIPMISGVACAVPAIMSARTIGSWKDRLITIMVTPLMSCAARLPVYALLIALVIPDQTWMGLFNLQGMVLMSLYLIGFLAAIGSAWVMKYVIKSKERSFFIMEIPDYRMPRWKNIVITIFEKVKVFVLDAGKVIVAISIVLWVLASAGPGSEFDRVSDELKNVDENNTELASHLAAEKLSLSYAGRAGQLLEPLIEPLGFDWKIGIALITSFAAREVFVGTMSTIYSVGNQDEDILTVKEKMSQEIRPSTGAPMYDLATGLSLMLFYAFAMQCMSTLAVVKRETGTWKWPLIQFAFMSALAYLSSLIIYQALS
jgi:ferrous iron transport protein B